MTDEEKVAEFRDKYRDHEIAVFRSSFGWLVFRSPASEAYEDFLETAAGGKGRKGAALRSLCLRSVLEPEHDRLVEIFAKKPGLPDRIAARLCEMATEELEDLAKKG